MKPSGLDPSAAEDVLRQVLLLLEGLGPAPPGCRLDAAGLLRAAARRLGLDPHAVRETLPTGRLDRLVDRALGVPSPQADLGASRSGRARTPEAWVEELWSVIDGAGGRAAGVLRHRLEGWEPREIADRVGLGLRRVRDLLDRMARQRSRESCPC